MERSEALGLSYVYYPNLNQLIFEDGVCYTTEEAVIIAKMKPVDLRAVHLIKKTFGGSVIRESVGKSVEEQDKSWFELVPSVKEPDPTQIPVKSVKREIQPDAEVLKFEL